MADIVVVGDVIDDVVVLPDGPVRPDTDTTSLIEVQPGGSGANTAAWLGSLGIDTAFVGTVGRADLARHAAALQRHGVTVELAASAAPTGAIVLISDGHERTMFTSRGANVETTPAAVTDLMLAMAKHVHISGYSVFSSPYGWGALIDRAHAVGARVSVDLASAGFLRDFGADRFLAAIEGVDLVFANRAEAHAATGVTEPSWAARALAFPTTVIKLGADGALAVDDDGPVSCSATRVEAIDVTGAGDAFDAGFLSAWIGGAELTACLEVAVATAARAVVVAGGRPV